MISNENLEQIKEVLYSNYLGSGKMIIGDLNKLRSLLDLVLNDTTFNKFRIVEACHFLHNKKYIIYINSAQGSNLFGVILFTITPILIEEMRLREKIEQEEQGKNLKAWY